VTPGAPTASRARAAFGMGAGVAALMALVVLAFMVGRFPVTPAELTEVLWARLSGQPHALAPSVDIVDTLARTMASVEVPLGVLTAFVGAPFFVWLLAWSRRVWQ
jgi:ABC-type Fe3+-siderophore transport system permease subunit